MANEYLIPSNKLPTWHDKYNSNGNLVDLASCLANVTSQDSSEHFKPYHFLSKEYTFMHTCPYLLSQGMESKTYDGCYIKNTITKQITLDTAVRYFTLMRERGTAKLTLSMYESYPSGTTTAVSTTEYTNVPYCLYFKAVGGGGAGASGVDGINHRDGAGGGGGAGCTGVLDFTKSSKFIIAIGNGGALGEYGNDGNPGGSTYIYAVTGTESQTTTLTLSGGAGGYGGASDKEGPAGGKASWVDTISLSSSTLADGSSFKYLGYSGIFILTVRNGGCGGKLNANGGDVESIENKFYQPDQTHFTIGTESHTGGSWAEDSGSGGGASIFSDGGNASSWAGLSGESYGAGGGGGRGAFLNYDKGGSGYRGCVEIYW